jgi:hypothetical protein
MGSRAGSSRFFSNSTCRLPATLSGRASTSSPLQPFVTKLLPHSWYVQSQPIITLDFAKETSSVALNLVILKLFAGRWNVNVQATVYPRWTSPPSRDYELRLSIGYQLPALLSKP